MSLIECPDCGKSVSSQASVCPNCGRPIASQQANQQRTQDEVTCAQTEDPHKGCIIAAAIGILIMIGVADFLFDAGGGGCIGPKTDCEQLKDWFCSSPRPAFIELYYKDVPVEKQFTCDDWKENVKKERYGTDLEHVIYEGMCQQFMRCLETNMKPCR